MSRNWLIGTQDVNYNNVVKNVHFNPALPYMYVPVSDFSHLTDIIQSQTNFPGTTIVVDTDINQIYWKDTCENTRKTMADYSLSLNLYDDTTAADPTNSFTVTLSKERMTVDGKYFGFPSRCYMPLFGNFQDTNSNEFYLGSHTMYEEYVVYDNSLYGDGPNQKGKVAYA